MSHRVIGICGGIGSGKSVVSDLLRVMGYFVYDCDSRAKAIVDSSPAIRKKLIEEFGEDIVREDESLDRKLLGAIVFNDEEKLLRLNSIVHCAVIEDLEITIDRHSKVRTIKSTNKEQINPEEAVFFETAILYESGLDALCDEIWWVDAPRELRIERVMRRNNLSRDEVIVRMKRQTDTPNPSPALRSIRNYGANAITPQVVQLLSVII